MINKVMLPSRKILTALYAFFIFINMGYAVTSYAKYALGKGRLMGLVPLFDLNGENSIPTWFETIEFFVAGILLYLLSRIKQNRGNPWTRHWTILSLIFMVLSIDEAAAIHELSIEPLRQYFGISNGYLYYTWVIPGIILLGALICFYWKFLWSLPSILKKRIFIAGMVFIGGAVVAELFGGDVASNVGENSLVYVSLVWIEEFCEMLGLLLFIAALLDWFNKDAGEFSIAVT